ncbi:hypothetical protein SAMN05444340_11064 [Citreimonas salinaria]|uniref:Uncharacterized protein n=1 Tax=Citreimonas salinaria TaxID=321339 RepID=A0A1H3KRW0_9RHOB|nr:hypothetical protein SAMN05444340_11064 [Citreimonas salinaria]
MDVQSEFRVGKAGQYWAVFRGAHRVSPTYVRHEEAEDRRQRLARRAASKMRPCISCSALFRSEGPHHRMCPGCRTKSASADWMSREVL